MTSKFDASGSAGGRVSRKKFNQIFIVVKQIVCNRSLLI